MLTFLMKKAKAGKRSAILVLDPDDVERMKQGKPVTVDFSKDERNGVKLVAVVGFTPDRERLQKELDVHPAGRWKPDARVLLQALVKCQDLPERKSTDGRSIV